MKKIYVAVLRYIVPIEIIDQHRSDHWKYLDECYKKKYFIVSGPLTPRNGGIILVQAQSRKEALDILHQDPFSQHNLAEYQVFDMEVTRHIDELNGVLKDYSITSNA